MIPKDCPLSDKKKLQATLKTDCLLEEVSEKLDFCKGCPYSAEGKKAKITDTQFKEIMEWWVAMAGIKKNKDDTEDLPDK